MLNLQKQYGTELLEHASKVALQQGRPHRGFINNVLKNRREQLLLEKNEEALSVLLEHENLRGPGYYH